ncbi:unnamed protein product [Meloidogyne enterolobii]|uniref:Uncharacterized protein n=1 Tax=Meloidogyne enterolobii TaxID=390850 RepID=A0ACB1AIV1_MELEN
MFFRKIRIKKYCLINTNFLKIRSRERIAEAIDEYHKKTCVEWTPKAANDIDYVHILPDDGCYSLVGKVGRTDRDDYVNILWDNIDPTLRGKKLTD